MTTTYASVAPVTTLDQRRAALEIANDIRIRRARLKREIRVGKVSPVDVLETPPAFVSTMKVFDLLLAVPKLGTVKVQQMMRALSISASKTVAGMSDRQRDAIVRELRERAERRAG